MATEKVDNNLALGPNPTVGEHLRYWRARRGLSQLRVASEYGTSARHLSFVETGRARPSKELIVHLARSLEATNHEMNTCLLAGGYAPLHINDLDGHHATSQTLDKLIEQHDPFPAFVFNADWLVERMNPGGRWLCTAVMPDVPPEHHSPGADMIAALTNSDGLLSRMRDAAAVGAGFLHQLRLEQLTNPGLEPRANRLAQSLRDRYLGYVAGESPDHSSYHFEFDTAHGALTLFTLQCVVGIPQQITVATPRVELWFPADAHTRQVIEGNVPASG